MGRIGAFPVVVALIAALVGGLLAVSMKPAGGGPLLAATRAASTPIPQSESGANARLESALAQVAIAFAAGGSATATNSALEMALPLDAGQVRVIVEAGTGQAAAVASTVVSQHGRVEKIRWNLVQALIPLSALEPLASSSGVEFVRLPYRRLPLVTGEGVSLIAASDWHAAGLAGGGVKIAVLDLGFEGYASLLGTELPDTVVTHSCRADADITGGGQVHGTGVAEIVHEVAPDAQLYLVNFDTDVEYAECVDWIVDQDVDVINHSVGWFGGGPGDGTGPINDVAADAVSAGVVWANAAGNQTQRHWSGAWQDGDGNSWLDFGPDDEGNDISVYSGQTVVAILKWDDPFGGSCNDYDLYLKRLNGTNAASSTNIQDCSQDPVEVLEYISSIAAPYSLYVHNAGGDGTANFHLYTFRHNLQHQVTAGSLVEPADNPNVLAAGAVPWNSPDTIEYFSSQGPTDDGRVKPDLVGPDAVGNSTYGSFWGTSASSPHAAGAAALVRQAHPAWNPDQVSSLLKERAVDLGDTGTDNVYGAGRVDLGEPEPLPDTDEDGVPDWQDNCPLVSNPGQQNADKAIDNGPGIPGDDTTVPNSDSSDSEGDACESDGDADNDGLPDSQDTNPLGPTGLCAAFPGSTDDHPNPAAGDLTYDDDANGIMLDATDDGPSWDTDADGVLDGVECSLGFNPRDPASKPSTTDCGGTDDTDGDGLQNAWETCGWGTDPTLLDSDGDTINDCREVADVDGSGYATLSDVIFIARGTLIASPPTRSGDFDVNKNGFVTITDVMPAAKIALITGFCP